jgi:hypothetical protein
MEFATERLHQSAEGILTPCGRSCDKIGFPD